MTPNDKNPDRYKNRSHISKAIAGLIATGATAAVIYGQLLDEKEGSRTKAYWDGAHIATICRGLTRIYGRPVVITDQLSKAECDRLDAAEQARGLYEMSRLVKPDVWASLSPATQAALASVCIHNLGADKCSRSTFLRELNAGHRNEACAAITLYIRDGGKDCRERANGCFGQIDRRQLEDELCLVGADS